MWATLILPESRQSDATNVSHTTIMAENHNSHDYELVNQLRKVVAEHNTKTQHCWQLASMSPCVTLAFSNTKASGSSRSKRIYAPANCLCVFKLGNSRSKRAHTVEHTRNTGVAALKRILLPMFSLCLSRHCSLHANLIIVSCYPPTVPVSPSIAQTFAISHTIAAHLPFDSLHMLSHPLFVYLIYPVPLSASICSQFRHLSFSNHLLRLTHCASNPP